MAFRPEKKFPEFADLKGILAQSRRQLDQATYQTLAQLIDRLTDFKLENENKLSDLLTEEEADLLYAAKTATYITENDETSLLPNSRQLLAGTGIVLDDSVAGELTVSTVGAGGAEWSVLTNSNSDNPELIFADGDVIMTHTP